MKRGLSGLFQIFLKFYLFICSRLALRGSEPRPYATCTKMVKIACVVPEISSRTHRQTHTHTHTCPSQYFATAPAGEVIITNNNEQFHLGNVNTFPAQSAVHCMQSTSALRRSHLLVFSDDRPLGNGSPSGGRRKTVWYVTRGRWVSSQLSSVQASRLTMRRRRLLYHGGRYHGLYGSTSCCILSQRPK